MVSIVIAEPGVKPQKRNLLYRGLKLVSGVLREK